MTTAIIVNLIKILFSTLFISGAVIFMSKIINKIASERVLLLKISIIILTALVSVFIVDVIVFQDNMLLNEKSRIELLSMIKYMIVGIIGFYFYEKNTKTPEK